MWYAVVLLVFSFLEILGCHCKDMEDDRSLYTNTVRIHFKGSKPLKVKQIRREYSSKTNSKTFKSVEVIDENGKKQSSNALDNLSNLTWPVPLLPNASHVTLRFFYDASSNKKKRDKVVIYYHKADVLLSPNCGIKSCYIIDKVTSTFDGGATVLVPDGKVIDSSNQTRHVEISY